MGKLGEPASYLGLYIPISQRVALQELALAKKMRLAEVVREAIAEFLAKKEVKND